MQMIADLPPIPLQEQSPAQILADQPLNVQQEFYARLTEEEAKILLFDWQGFWARPKQRFPASLGKIHLTWLNMSGRGNGKTRTGAESVRYMVNELGYRRIALIGRTAADVRDVMVEGEALSIATLIPTTNGLKPMSDIVVGDKVFDENGQPCNVVAVTPFQYNRPCYKVVFSDGTEIIADERHQWLTADWHERLARSRCKNPKNLVRTPQIRTTKQILDTLWHNNNRNHAIDPCSPIHYPEQILTIHPYVLGVWLGDGRVRDSTITSADTELIDKITSLGYQVNKHKAKYNYWIRGLTATLRGLNLLNNKHIPDVYLHSSIEQRWHLLQGLMDTDGYVSKRGQCAFDNNNYELVLQVRQLLLSLGIIVGMPCPHKQQLKGKVCKSVWRITFTPQPGQDVVSLSRKQERLPAKLQVRSSYRIIENVMPVDSVPVKCIQVDSPSHLYLAGQEYIPTHNSGILSVFPDGEKPLYEPAKRRITFANGAIASLYSADKPDQLRGPQHDGAWCDELAAWRYEDAWDQLQFGLRLRPQSGLAPICIVTTTPRPIPLIKALVKDKTVLVTTGTTYENARNLAAPALRQLITKYKGTRLGLQELEAHILDDTPGALWTRANIDLHRKRQEDVPLLVRVVVGVDPSVSSGEKSAETGIIAAGIDRFGHIYVLDDQSLKGRPSEWAKAAVGLYDVHDADRIVAEVNNGGDMVETTIRTENKEVSFKQVHATKGKYTRAEPVSALYEQGRVSHVGAFGELEDQLCTWLPGEKSPDRLDALVWAITELALRNNGKTSTNKAGVRGMYPSQQRSENTWGQKR